MKTDKKETDYFKLLNATFRIEAEEHLNAFSAGLIDLKRNQTKEGLGKIIESMHREIHSLKGAAHSADQKEVESLCQPLESIFAEFKRQEISLSPSSFNIFDKSVDRLSNLILTDANRNFQQAN
jgi:two-component system chemotaxis sensor kinase CheA